MGRGYMAEAAGSAGLRKVGTPMQNYMNGQRTLVGVEDGWEVLDVAQAVATQRQAGAGEAQPIVLSSTAHTVSLNHICTANEADDRASQSQLRGQGKTRLLSRTAACARKHAGGIAPYRHGRTEQGLTTTSKAHFLWKGARGSP